MCSTERRTQQGSMRKYRPERHLIEPIWEIGLRDFPNRFAASEGSFSVSCRAEINNDLRLSALVSKIVQWCFLASAAYKL